MSYYAGSASLHPNFQEQMAMQTPSSSRILLAARSLLLLVPLPSAPVGAGHDQILHNYKPDSHFCHFSYSKISITPVFTSEEGPH